MMDVKTYTRPTADEESKNGLREIEAVQITPWNVSEVARWCGGVVILEHDAMQHDKTFVGINYRHFSGTAARAGEYDWMCRDSRGRFYSLRDKTFTLLYNS